MENKGKLYLGLAIMVGLIFLGLMLPRTAREFRSFERTVSVKGLCEREVPADKVIWPVVYKVVGNDLGSVYRAIENKKETIFTFLKKGGIDEKDISVSVPSLSDKDAQELLGHSSIAVTRDVYTHIRPSRRQETADRLNAFVVSTVVKEPGESEKP